MPYFGNVGALPYAKNKDKMPCKKPIRSSYFSNDTYLWGLHSLYLHPLFLPPAFDIPNYNNGGIKLKWTHIFWVPIPPL
jgi:hypothetical protein